MHNPVDHEYFTIIDMIQNFGVDKSDRTGVGTRSYFGTRMEFDLSNYAVPLLTTKKVFTKGFLHELIWMLSGDTNIRYLKEHGINIWDSWIDKKTAEYAPLTLEEITKAMCSFLGEKNVVFANNDIEVARNAYRGAFNKEPMKLIAGNLPNIYQKQWVSWDDTRIVDWEESDTMDLLKRGFTIYTNFKDGSGVKKAVVTRKVNQIQNAIDRLKTNPDCRRIIVSAWNVGEIEDMALPPCHCFFQFWTRELTLEERSALVNDSHTAGASLRLGELYVPDWMDAVGIPKRALSCQLLIR